MQELYQEVLQALQKENKERAVTLCLDALDSRQVSVVELYEMILVPGLANVIEEYPETEELIWREHVRSGIIRTIIESAYPYILAEQKKTDKKKGKVIVMCPEYEDHELGARMVADYFRLAGYESTFIGARTPERTVLKAIEIVRPKYLSISVTNYFNLISVKRTIEHIKAAIDYDLIFIVGGRAFDKNPAAFQQVGAHMLMNDYTDIEKIEKEVF